MTLQAGENVGPYRILNQLGQGGMATVFKAYHAQLDRHVAIKIMHQALQEDESFHVRFKREAQIVARLAHPNIIPIYDFNEHKGQPYLVMKFVEGITLKKMLSRKPLTLNAIMHIFTAVGSALAYAHEQGVLHRDIKPSNIMIDKDRTPYLTDFGLARMAQAGESTLSQDMLLGTPHYISPEQATGKKDLDARTDIYSLGVVLYELTVGRVPFSADTPYAVIHDHIYTPLPLPTVVNPDVSPQIEQVLLKALAKSPKDRYETATELVAAFKTAIDASGIKELSPNRASVAAVSLAKMRDEQANAIGVGQQPAIPAPIPAGTPISSTASQQRASRRNRWLVGGLVALVFVCFATVAVTANALENFNERALQTTQDAIDAGIVPAPIDRLDVPEWTLDEARQKLEENPEDAVTHLALARALWQDNQASAGLEIYAKGLPFADNPASYALTAGMLADESGQDTATTIIAIQTLERFQNDAEVYPFIRSEVGAFLYERAIEAEGNSFRDIIQSLSNDDVNFEEIKNPVTDALLARALITQGRFALADARLRRNLADDVNVAESHLVLGELFQARNNTARALREWEMVSDDDNAPQWVLDRAAELIAINSGV